MKCAACGAADMVSDTRDVQYIYKGQTTTIAAVKGEFCPLCGESLHDKDESARVNALMMDFNKTVNESIFDPSFITKVRKKLNLDQREAAEIFGGGVNAFSRYENGKTNPPISLIRLLKLLYNHPELLEEVKAEAAEEKSRASA